MMETHSYNKNNSSEDIDNNTLSCIIDEIQDDDDDDDDDDDGDNNNNDHFDDERSSGQQEGGRRQSSLVGNTDAAFLEQERLDSMFVQSFWTAYDEILILSITTQVGILCRLLAAYWLKNFDNVFHKDSALFTNLPLNCLSCFVMGLLCSGESLMEIIATRFTSTTLQRDLLRKGSLQRIELQNEDDGNNNTDDTGAMESRTREIRRRRNQHQQRQQERLSNNVDGRNELREVQLLAWERRIRASICLLLFPVKKKDIDIVENYMYASESCREETNLNCHESRNEEKLEKNNCNSVMHEQDEIGCRSKDEIELDDISENPLSQIDRRPLRSISKNNDENDESTNNESVVGKNYDRLSRDNNNDVDCDTGRNHARGNIHISARQYGQVEGGNIVDYGTRENPDLDQIISSMTTNVSNNISRIGRVNLAKSWDVGTSPQEKSEDLVLGLRDGLCGALSSFSSWLSSMVNLFRSGNIGQAVVGILLGIQLPIVAYRFGQYVSVYVFVWRCRREKGKDEKRGYGIQLHTSDDGESTNNFPPSISNPRSSSFDSTESPTGYSQRVARTKGRRTVYEDESEIPSIRAIFTALFIMCLVAQLTSLTFFKEPEDRFLALSLLFSPLGVLARWRMMKFNTWRPSFPIGTFACNITACALSGTLGTLIAGNPGPKERTVLVSIIAGFGGTLSSVARFIVETLSLLDPILYRLDGFYYATASIAAGLLVSFLFAASVDWADSVE